MFAGRLLRRTFRTTWSLASRSERKQKDKRRDDGVGSARPGNQRAMNRGGGSLQHQMTLTNICPEARLTGPLRRHGQALASLIVAWQRVAPSFVAAALLGGCATSPRPDAAHASLSTAVATQWHSPLPHGGNLADLSRWWARFDDPLLLRLIEAGQQASATLAQAATGYALRVFPRPINPASRRPTKQAST
jgi:hypothetical protein